MSKMLIIIFLFIPFIALGAHEHILHVGDINILLYSEKYTTPSLNVKIGESIFYAPMLYQEQTDTLHIKLNNTTYTTCKYELAQKGNYTFCGDYLIGANKNVYLESTGTQYIDTLFLPNQNTGVIIDAQYVRIGSNAWVFGVRYSPNKEIFSLAYNANITQYIFGYNTDIGNYKTPNPRASYDRHLFSLLQGKCYIDNELLYTHPYRNFQSTNNMYIFCYNYNRAAECSNVKVYFMDIYDSGTLVRHFVPVPAGIVIGDYVVPSNGMWDIVEQKFYGNSGTGNFIYGID